MKGSYPRFIDSSLFVYLENRPGSSFPVLLIQGGLYEMIIDNKQCDVNGLCYTIRSAVNSDAAALSEARVQIDGETEIWIANKGRPSSMPPDLNK